MSSVTLGCRARKRYALPQKPNNDYAPTRLVDKAIMVEDDSIVLDPKYMKVGEFYPAIVGGQPYFYRRVTDAEIEVYGFAR